MKAPTISTDKSDWLRHFMDTPFTGLVSQARRNQLAPGTCVQSTDGKLFGRVHTNPHLTDPVGEEGIVIGHGMSNEEHEKFVWRGDAQDFARLWVID